MTHRRWTSRHIRAGAKKSQLPGAAASDLFVSGIWDSGVTQFHPRFKS
jgi:hypothetical protein